MWERQGGVQLERRACICRSVNEELVPVEELFMPARLQQQHVGRAAGSQCADGAMQGVHEIDWKCMKGLAIHNIQILHFATATLLCAGFIIPQEIPGHSWIKRGAIAPANRYNIKPGRWWDGVDRGNGFERQMFLHMNNRRAQELEARMWAQSDM